MEQHDPARGNAAAALAKLGLLRDVQHPLESSIFDRTGASPLPNPLPSAEVSGWVGFLPTDDIFMVAHRMAYPTANHTHDYLEFSYTLEGSALNVVDGKSLYMLEGSLCVMNLNSRHRLEVIDTDSVIVNLGLRPSLFSEGIFRDFLQSSSLLARFLAGETGKGYLFFSDSKDRALRTSMLGLAEAYATSEGSGASFEVAGRVLLLLDRLAKMPGYSLFGIDDKALKMMDYIRAHCDTVTIKTLARAFGYSENYTTQYIRSHTGRTATELIAEARVARAEMLLATTDLSVSAVAAAVGYRSVGHFNELFRTHHGMTPGDYRKLATSGLL